GVLSQGFGDSLVVFYHGVPSGSGLGSFSQTFHDNVASIWTLSEPYGALDWWPCKQDLNDKVDSMDILVTTTAGNRAASNGKLVEEIQNPDSTVTFHWQTHYPIAAYLVGVAVTNYAVVLDSVAMASGDTFPVVNYVYPEHVPDAVTQLSEIKNIIRLFDSLLFDYPFAAEKYGHAEFGWGGGMEHQ